jgi:hypothetical protein
MWFFLAVRNTGSGCWTKDLCFSGISGASLLLCDELPSVDPLGRVGGVPGNRAPIPINY